MLGQLAVTKRLIRVDHERLIAQVQGEAVLRAEERWREQIREFVAI